MFELGMGVIHVEDQQPFDGNGRFRERARKPRELAEVCFGSGQHLKETKGKEHKGED